MSNSKKQGSKSHQSISQGKSSRSNMNTSVSGHAPSRPTADAARPRPTMPSQRAVAEAAYFLWQKRGGDQFANWLEAEAKLKHGTKN
jgi:hypothetical protein